MRDLAGVGAGVHGWGDEGSLRVVAVPEELGEHPQSRDPVREAVVDPDHERGPPAIVRAHDVHAPERPLVVESLGHHLAHEPDQGLAIADRLRREAHVAPDVETLVVDPRGAPRREGEWARGAGALAEGRRGAPRPAP